MNNARFSLCASRTGPGGDSASRPSVPVEDAVAIPLLHEEELAPFLDYVVADKRVDSLVVPVGKGVLVCRKA